MKTVKWHNMLCVSFVIGVVAKKKLNKTLVNPLRKNSTHICYEKAQFY